MTKQGANDAEIGSGDIFETLHNGLTVVLLRPNEKN